MKPKQAVRPKTVENDASKSIFGLGWPWPLTSWPRSWLFDAVAPRCGPLLPICIKIDSFVFKISCSQVDKRRTNGRTDGQTDRRTVWEHNASACQSGLPGRDRRTFNNYNKRCDVLAAAIQQVPPDWKRPIGGPSHTWLRAIEADLGPLNFGLATAWRKATLLGMNGDILWTQQRCSGICYERKKERERDR